jgi:hypothetical protein
MPAAILESLISCRVAVERGEHSVNHPVRLRDGLYNSKHMLIRLL